MGALDGVPGGVICERAVGSDVPAVHEARSLVGNERAKEELDHFGCVSNERHEP